MKINNLELYIEHSPEKKITIEDIIECVFGDSIETVADNFNRIRIKEAG